MIHIDKRCSTCGHKKSTPEFFRNRSNQDGLSGQCKQCHSESARRTRDPEKARRFRRESARRCYAKDPQLVVERNERSIAKYPEKQAARRITHAAIRRGEIKRPVVCSKCKETHLRIDAHHPDYSEPLCVVWLCARCHGEEHVETLNKTPIHVDKPHTDRERGIWFWRSTYEGIDVQLCNKVTNLTPYWCEQHKRATSVRCSAHAKKKFSFEKEKTCPQDIHQSSTTNRT